MARRRASQGERGRRARVPVLALDRIVKSKLAAGRPKDLAVASTLVDFQRTLEVVSSL
jgi:hypothetical protein